MITALFQYPQNKPVPAKPPANENSGWQTRPGPQQTTSKPVIGPGESGHRHLPPKDSIPLNKLQCPDPHKKRPNHVGNLFNKSQDSSDEEADYEYEYEYEYQYEDANNFYVNTEDEIREQTEFDDPNYTDPTDIHQRGPHVPPRNAGISSPRPQLPPKKQTPTGAAGNAHGNGVGINAITAELNTKLGARAKPGGALPKKPDSNPVPVHRNPKPMLPPKLPQQGQGHSKPSQGAVHHNGQGASGVSALKNIFEKR